MVFWTHCDPVGIYSVGMCIYSEGMGIYSAKDKRRVISTWFLFFHFSTKIVDHMIIINAYNVLKIESNFENFLNIPAYVVSQLNSSL